MRNYGKKNGGKTSKLGVGSASQKSDNQTYINETCRRSTKAIEVGNSHKTLAIKCETSISVNRQD